METIDIILIVALIIIALLLIVSLVAIFNLMKKNRGNNNNSALEEKFAKSALETKVAMNDELDKISKSLQAAISNQNESLNNFKDSLIKQNNDNKDVLNKNLNDSFIKLNDRINQNFKDDRDHLQDSLNKGFETNYKHLGLVNESLGKISESQKNLDNLNNEVIKLNNVFSNSQLRGRFGEIQLEKILESIFGDTRDIYSLQYDLKVKGRDNVRPDAVIFLKNQDDESFILCIDSKFSFVEYSKIFDEDPKTIDKTNLSKLKSDLQSQIRKIAHDYIIKDVTYDYALMFIPSDSIYTFIQMNDYLYVNVIEYARKNNVLITCPSLLQPILANINFLRINLELSKNIKSVMQEINKVHDASIGINKAWQDFSKTFEALNKKKEKLDKPIENMVKKTNNAVTMAIKKEVISQDDLKEIEEVSNDEDALIIEEKSEEN